MSCSENLPGEENETTADMGNSDVEIKAVDHPEHVRAASPASGAHTGFRTAGQSLPGET